MSEELVRTIDAMTRSLARRLSARAFLLVDQHGVSIVESDRAIFSDEVRSAFDAPHVAQAGGVAGWTDALEPDAVPNDGALHVRLIAGRFLLALMVDLARVDEARLGVGVFDDAVTRLFEVG